MSDKTVSSPNEPSDDDLQQILPEESLESADKADEAVVHTEEKFTLLRFTFSESDFILEKGELEEGDFIYTTITSGNLPVKFHPALVRSQDGLQKVADALLEQAGDALKPGARLAFVFPENWGFTTRIPNPGALPHEQLVNYIDWQLKLISSEDNEPQHYNYQIIDDDFIIVISVRKQVLKFIERLASLLKGRAVRFSLVGEYNIDLVQQDETPVDEAKSSRPLPRLLLTAGVFVIILAAAVYMFRDRLPFGAPGDTASQKEHIPPPDTASTGLTTDSVTTPADTVISVEDSVPSIEEPKPTAPESQKSPPGLYANLFDLFTSESRLNFLSITNGVIRAEINLNRRETVNDIIEQLETADFIFSAQILRVDKSAGKYNAIISAHIAESMLDSFIHPPYEDVNNAIQTADFVLEHNVFSGTLPEVNRLFDFIDRNRFLYYRISLSESGPGEYHLKLEY